MKVLKRIGLGLLGLIAVLLIIALFLPKEMHVQRDITIARPKDQVFSYISHLKNQNSYSKWALMDPNMQTSFRGTDGTPGFVSAWKGNNEVGEGEQEIKAIKQGERLETEIRFKEPFESKADAFMTTQAVDPVQTKVSWGFNGSQPYPMNIMRLFFNMDEMIGKDLEVGLANLKKNLESSQPIGQAVPQQP